MRYKYEIKEDEYPFDPREDDCNLSVLALSVRRYDLPNEMSVNFDDFGSWQEVHDYIKDNGGLFIKPVYAYIHGGITISLGSFSCKWDSGCIGFVFTTQEKINEWGISQDKVEARIEAEIEEYDKYLTGDCWQIEIIDTVDGEIVETYSGLGYSNMVKEAESCVAYLIKTTPEQLALVGAA